MHILEQWCSPHSGHIHVASCGSGDDGGTVVVSGYDVCVHLSKDGVLRIDGACGDGWCAAVVEKEESDGGRPWAGGIRVAVRAVDADTGLCVAARCAVEPDGARWWFASKTDVREVRPGGVFLAGTDFRLGDMVVRADGEVRVGSTDTCVHHCARDECPVWRATPAAQAVCAFSGRVLVHAASDHAVAAARRRARRRAPHTSTRFVESVEAAFTRWVKDGQGAAAYRAMQDTNVFCAYERVLRHNRSWGMKFRVTHTRPVEQPAGGEADGVSVVHTCGSMAGPQRKCTFFVLNGTLWVCRASGHVHWCTPDKCTLTATDPATGHCVCPVSLQRRRRVSEVALAGGDGEMILSAAHTLGTSSVQRGSLLEASDAAILAEMVRVHRRAKRALLGDDDDSGGGGGGADAPPTKRMIFMRNTSTLCRRTQRTPEEIRSDFRRIVRRLFSAAHRDAVRADVLQRARERAVCKINNMLRRRVECVRRGEVVRPLRECEIAAALLRMRVECCVDKMALPAVLDIHPLREDLLVDLLTHLYFLWQRGNVYDDVCHFTPEDIAYSVLRRLCPSALDDVREPSAVYPHLEKGWLPSHTAVAAHMDMRIELIPDDKLYKLFRWSANHQNHAVRPVNFFNTLQRRIIDAYTRSAGPLPDTPPTVSPPRCRRGSRKTSPRTPISDTIVVECTK